MHVGCYRNCPLMQHEDMLCQQCITIAINGMSILIMLLGLGGISCDAHLTMTPLKHTCWHWYCMVPQQQQAIQSPLEDIFSCESACAPLSVQTQLSNPPELLKILAFNMYFRKEQQFWQRAAQAALSMAIPRCLVLWSMHKCLSGGSLVYPVCMAICCALSGGHLHGQFGVPCVADHAGTAPERALYVCQAWPLNVRQCPQCSCESRTCICVTQTRRNCLVMS